MLSLTQPVLQAMGKNIVYCGESGAGEITKLCNNLSLAISMIGTSEAMALGAKLGSYTNYLFDVLWDYKNLPPLGMDPKILAGVMNTSTARCWSSDSYNPYPGITPGAPAENGYTGGFGTALMEKDLTLALDAAKAVKVYKFS